MYWRDWDYRYIMGLSGDEYVTFSPEYLHYLEKYGADEYDVLVAQTHVDNCGRVICYPGKNIYGYYEPVDDEFVLNELYYKIIELGI